MGSQTWPNPTTAAYRDLLQRLDTWFAESSARHPGVIPCRPGCSACCHGPFDISIADMALVHDALTRIPDAQRQDVRARADRQTTRMKEVEPAWDPADGLGVLTAEAFDRVGDALADEPCPLLDQDGNCLIYSDRPLICRLIGLGVVTPAGRVIENACPIASSFPEYLVLPPQSLDLESLEVLEVACLEAASVRFFGTPQHADFETTIAAAITTSP